jgi:hypothetical protein
MFDRSRERGKKRRRRFLIMFDQRFFCLLQKDRSEDGSARSWKPAET